METILFWAMPAIPAAIPSYLLCQYESIDRLLKKPPALWIIGGIGAILICLSPAILGAYIAGALFCPAEQAFANKLSRRMNS